MLSTLARRAGVGSLLRAALLRRGFLRGLGRRFSCRSFSGFTLFALLFRRGLLRNGSGVDPLDERHRGRVALAQAKLDDAGVAALPLRRAWRDVVEQLLHCILLTQH